MNNKKLLSLYGLKWNPFSPDLPVEAIIRTQKFDQHLAMAVWEILRDKIIDGPPTDEPDDFSFVDKFEQDADNVIFDPPL